MVPDELSQYKLLFIQTSWDYLRNLESNLQYLSSDLKNAEAIEAIHISAHSLKSQSLVMGYTQLGMVCKHIEHFFRDVKDGKKTLQKEQLAVLNNALDGIKDSLVEISSDGQEKDLPAIEKKLGETFGEDQA